jgi:hypothetical protein
MRPTEPTLGGVTYQEYTNNIPSGANLTSKTHGHHIVFKKSAAGGAALAETKEAKDILLYRGIDPYYGRENLVYAPN